jgi:hypothetical protein
VNRYKKLTSTKGVTHETHKTNRNFGSLCRNYRRLHLIAAVARTSYATASVYTNTVQPVPAWYSAVEFRFGDREGAA